jgi:hypothetical protein
MQMGHVKRRQQFAQRQVARATEDEQVKSGFWGRGHLGERRSANRRWTSNKITIAFDIWVIFTNSGVTRLQNGYLSGFIALLHLCKKANPL